MRQLYAYYESHRVGTLTKDDENVYSFEYAESWRNDPRAFPISLAMPLEGGKFGNKKTLSFFENLLPEGEVRKDLEEAHRISGTFHFLTEFGKDCAGAIVLTNQEDFVASSGEELIPLDMQKIDKAIEEKLSVAEVVSEQNPGYLSLAGAQDKFPAILKNGNFYLPKNGYPTTHIIKVPIWRHGVKESVYNEYFCMKLAQAIGFEVPLCQVRDGKQPLFIVERYDRKLENGTVHRVHQQDFCQAQGYSSDEKYEIKGGPSLRQNYEFILSNTKSRYRVQSLERFLDWVCFNLLIGNNDSHSKNISLILSNNREQRLAPFYDLMATAIYPRLEKRFSFRIGDRDEFSHIGSNQIVALEGMLGLKKNAFKKRLQITANKIGSKYRLLAKELTKSIPNAKIPLRICDLIDSRVKSLKFQGALD